MGDDGGGGVASSGSAWAEMDCFEGGFAGNGYGEFCGDGLLGFVDKADGCAAVGLGYFVWDEGFRCCVHDDVHGEVRGDVAYHVDDPAGLGVYFEKDPVYFGLSRESHQGIKAGVIVQAHYPARFFLRSVPFQVV